MDEADRRRERRLHAWTTLLAVPAAGAVVLAAFEVDRSSVSSTLFLLAVSVALNWFSSRMRAFEGFVTLTSVVVIAAYPLVGPWGAVIVSVAPLLDFANRLTWLQRVFNAASAVLPSLVGVGVWSLLAVGPGIDPRDFTAAVVACFVTDLVRFVCNALLFAPIAVLVSDDRPAVVMARMKRDVWRSVLPAHLGNGPLGVLLAVLWAAGLGPLAALLVLAPLVAAHIALARATQEEDAREETMRTLIQAVETKDPYTRGHSERVSRGVELLGTATGVTGSRLGTLRFAGLLHDVGKLGVPTRVLTKKGSLTAEEFDEIRAHPLQGFDIVTGIAFLDDARLAILHHHERLDGAGYPAGLAGTDIPEFARMIAVVDAFDSMTSSRSYHRARSVGEALAELQRCAGSHFDPAYVTAFCTTVERRGWRLTTDVSGIAVSVGEPAGDEAGVPAIDDRSAAVAPWDHDDPTVAAPTVCAAP